MPIFSSTISPLGRYHRESQIWWEYQKEIARPPKICVTFYETRLDQADVQKLTTEAVDEVDYTPSPQFYSYGSQNPPTLEYDPQIYSMRWSIVLIKFLSSLSLFEERVLKLSETDESSLRLENCISWITGNSCAFCTTTKIIRPSFFTKRPRVSGWWLPTAPHSENFRVNSS